MTPYEELLLGDLEDEVEKLNDWEREFVASIRGQLDANENVRLTERQYDKLYELWEQYCD